MSTNPFSVSVARLLRRPGTPVEVTCTGVVDDLSCAAAAVPDGEACEVTVTLEALSGGVSAAGTVRAPWRGTCRRCLSDVSGVLRVDVRELFTPDGDGEETYPLDDDTIDLTPLVRDAVLLELPQAPLCREDCRGLCPHCGANRNERACSCRPPRDERWAALDALRVPDTTASEDR